MNVHVDTTLMLYILYVSPLHNPIDVVLFLPCSTRCDSQGNGGRRGVQLSV